jgi:hypothetical protein
MTNNIQNVPYTMTPMLRKLEGNKEYVSNLKVGG